MASPPSGFDEGPRYAIYFVPPANSALYRFGSAILGYDCYTGQDVPHPADLPLEAADRDGAAAEARRYGFHATLKAPFYLSPSCSEAQLVSALHSFAGLGHAVGTVIPTIRMLSGFAAIMPEQADPTVDALAARCTTIFDAFRAPMSPQERARRIALGLTHGQVQNLDRWGYPYLFADFRFHMTLTGKIKAGRRDWMLASLRGIWQRMHADRPIAVDRLALAKQDDATAAFRIIAHTSLQRPS